MARLKRAANDPQVLIEARLRNRRTTAARLDPDSDSGSGSDRPSTPVTTCFAADTVQYGSPSHRSAASSSTAFRAPRLVEIEAEEDTCPQLDIVCASPAPSTIDLVDSAEPSPLSEYRARHIARVADQRARRHRNPPPRLRTVYTCRPCARSFTSQRQLSHHKTSGRHARAVNRLHDLAARLHCTLCDLPFADRHNYEIHNRSRIHLRNTRRQQESRLN